MVAGEGGGAGLTPRVHGTMEMQRLLKATVQFHASDLHVQAGSPPTVRVDGTMVAINAPGGDGGAAS